MEKGYDIGEQCRVPKEVEKLRPAYSRHGKHAGHGVDQPWNKARLRDNLVAVELRRDSSPGGKMRQQTKPFIVEIKQSRKPKANDQEPSSWGKLDLKIADEPVAPVINAREPAATVAATALD